DGADPPCSEAVGRGTAAKRWWRDRNGSANGPSVSPMGCHLPIASRQGGSKRSTIEDMIVDLRDARLAPARRDIARVEEECAGGAVLPAAVARDLGDG